MNRLKLVREFYNEKNQDNQISQADVARYLGISRQGYAKIESGKSRVDVFTGIRLARLFKEKIDAIFVVRK